ncbi:hypothetical protein MKW92_020593, partial [Papaver armeniacum]
MTQNPPNSKTPKSTLEPCKDDTSFITKFDYLAIFLVVKTGLGPHFEQEEEDLTSLQLGEGNSLIRVSRNNFGEISFLHLVSNSQQ